MVIFWIIIGVLFVLSLVLLFGKGAWLIAGYNTMNIKDKQKYDPIRLTRAVGLALLLIDAATVPLIYVHTFIYSIFYFVFVCAATIILIVCANSKCLASGTAARSPESGGSPKKRRAVTTAVIVFLVLLAAAGLTTLIVSGERPPVYTISAGDGTFTIDSMYGRVIDLADIQSVELEPELPDGLSRTNGYGGFGSALKGECRSAIGDVTVYVDKSEPPFIYLVTTDGTYILNAASGDQTQALYNELILASAPRVD